MRSKYELAEQYAEGKSSSSVFQEAHKRDFLAGYEAGQPKWISVETPPDDERNVIIKIFDYRRPKEKVTEIGLGYFDHEEKEWYHTSDVLVNGGHGWMITHYMEIPQ